MSSKAIAFFPWWNVARSLTIGPIRLLAYQRTKSPGDLPGATQTDLDGVLGAYANRPKHRITSATILEVDDWRTGQDPESVLTRLFAAREALAFSALAERKLFNGHFNYCNFDTYSLVVQRYVAGKTGRFAYTTRRRDGGVSNMWSSDEFAFQRPLHVYDYTGPHLDIKLAALLMEDVPHHWLDAVAEFNRANTDSRDVMPHVEVVMMKSAFEWLFHVGPEVQQFTGALERCLSDIPLLDGASGPLQQRWSDTWPKATRLLLAWAREFCALRGTSAHGSRRSIEHFVWTEAAHLAFASMLFPLLFKKVASDADRYVLDEDDYERLRRIDHYIPHDPMMFDADAHASESQHPWILIDSEAKLEKLHRLGMETLERGLAEANSPD